MENGVPSFLAIGAVGLPLMMLGIVVIALTNKKLLPERQPADPQVWTPATTNWPCGFEMMLPS